MKNFVLLFATISISFLAGHAQQTNRLHPVIEPEADSPLKKQAYIQKRCQLANLKQSPSEEQEKSDFQPQKNNLDVHCFIAGTKIVMGNGPNKNIEEIKENDIILAYDIEKKRHTLALVKGIAKEEHSDLVTYIFENKIEITTTQDHPFLLQNLMWASSKPRKTERYSGYNIVNKIKIGDSVRLLNATTKLSQIIPLNEKQMTYTITKLNNGDAFFANGVSVGVEGLPDELLVKETFQGK